LKRIINILNGISIQIITVIINLLISVLIKSILYGNIIFSLCLPIYKIAITIIIINWMTLTNCLVIEGHLSFFSNKFVHNSFLRLS
jgi:hypothetical protein